MKSSPDKETQGDAKNQLFMTAARLFAEKGYHRVSIREICDQAGLSKPMIYYYFKDKRTLFGEMIKESERIAEELVREFIESEQGYIDKLHGIFRLHLAYLKRYQTFAKFFCAVHFMSLDDELKAKVAELLKQQIQRLSLFMQQGQSEGYIEAWYDPLVLSISLFGSIRYLMLYYLRGVNSRFDIEYELEQLFHIWEKSILVHK